MARSFVLLLSLLLAVAVPPGLYAKAKTSRITINGRDLKEPVVITDPTILSNFSVWTSPSANQTGPDAAAQEARGFIAWSRGAVMEPAKELTRYQVSFYAKLPNEQLIYVVFYVYDPTAAQGYIYLPGKTDDWYRLNRSTILHDADGSWFFATDAWERVANPSLSK